MISPASLIGITLVALGMALTPGPNMIYLVSRSISQGRTAGLVSLGGTMVGFLVYLTMASLGLAVVFVVVPWLYVTVKVAGAGYLLYLAWNALRPGGTALFEARPLPQDPKSRLFRMGLLTNLLNPKAAIMYLTLIPQFIVPDRGGVVAQGLLLGIVQIGVSCAVNTLIVLTAGAIAAFLQRRPSWAQWQRRVTGTALAAIGIRLLLDAPSRAAV